MTFLRKLFAKRQGYTIDQTILIIAIIAILITLIILTIAWALINRSSGTRLGSQLTQVEDAVGQFYAAQHRWPSQSFTVPPASGSSYAYALMGPSSGYTWDGSVDQTRLRNYLKGLNDMASYVGHNYGSQTQTFKRVMIMPGTASAAGVGTGNYMIIQFTNVPFKDAEEADKATDGSFDPEKGRVLMNVGSSTNFGTQCLPASGGAVVTAAAATVSAAKLVNVCYVANAM